MHVRPSHVRQVDARESGAEVDARKYGAELGARIYGSKIHGAELMPCPRHASSHVNDTKKMILDLSAKTPRCVSSAPIVTAPRSGSIF